MKKQSVTDLAYFGGTPEFEIPLHVGRPNIGDKDLFLKYVDDIFESRWLTNDGKYSLEFERAIEEKLGVKHCIATCNGTIALELASRALGMKGEVIVPSFTFVATAHSLQWQQITPVFCDIDPATHTIDPAKIKSLITPRTTGILGVHLWGHSCNIEALEKISADHNLKLLFDAAHAFGCSHGTKMIGGFGDAEVFSFHATKFLNTFEGGAVVTNNDELAEKLRLMRNFGFLDTDQVIYIGTNAKMNEVCAAMGLSGLRKYDEFISRNRKNYKSYLEQLAGQVGISILKYESGNTYNYQYLITEIEENLTGVSRDFIVDILTRENILVRKYFSPGCHRMEPYKSYFPNAGMLLPETERMVRRVLCLPTGISMDEEKIIRVCELIKFILNNAKEISDRTRN